MATIESFIVNLQRFSDGLYQLVDKTVVNNETYLIDEVLQKRLFNNGITGNSTSLPDYSIRTVSDKIRLGKRYNNMTLNQTGDWYKDMYITSRKGVIEADSLDDKTDTLVLRYGIEILEFQEVEQKIFVEDVLDPIIQQKLDKLMSENIILTFE
jgi:hypothetical protein